MSFNLLDAVRGIISPELIDKAASSLGENESGITKAISGIIPTILGGMVSKATGGDHGASSVLEMAKTAAGTGIMGNLGTLFNAKSGSGGLLEGGMHMINGLFGDKAGGIANLLAGFSGIKESSAATLLSMAAPPAMGVLGKHVTDNNLNAGSMTHLLASQKDSIISAIPPNLSSLGGMLGLGLKGSTVSSGAQQVKAIAGTAKNSIGEKSGSGTKWLFPVLLFLLAAALIWYFSRGCRNAKDHAITNTDSLKTDTIATPPRAAVAPASFKVKLPNGKELEANKGGIEDELVTFLGTNWKALPEDSLKKIWFNFDNLNFETSKAVLLPESEKQLDNITEILKAFPEAKAKLGGYTDKVGNEAINVKLSGQRASAAKSGLEKRGVATQVTGAEGYGSKFARYPSAAPDSDRIKDRHVSLSIRHYMDRDINKATCIKTGALHNKKLVLFNCAEQ